MATTIKVKRPVTIKTIVTEDFKKITIEELNKEMHILENQILQLEIQNKQIHDQAGSLKSMYGTNELNQIQETLNEISGRIQQMNVLKNELNTQKDAVHHLVLNNTIVTGNVENYVELNVGENIYEKFKDAEIIVKDGIIQEIRG